MKLSLSPSANEFLNDVAPPGSKSHTIRALFMAGSANGESTISGGLDSDDTRQAREGLRAIGVPIEDSGVNWVVGGTAGRFGPPDVDLDAGESGLTARFLLALTPLIPGAVTIVGRGRLPERPMSGLIQVLNEMGTQAEDTYPWTVQGGSGLPGGSFQTDASKTSQFVSALLAAAPLARTDTVLKVSGLTSSEEYIAITTGIMNNFGSRAEKTEHGYRVEPTGYSPTRYVVPVDVSAAVYPAAAAALTGGTVTIRGEFRSHPDLKFFDVLEEMGCVVKREKGVVVVGGPDQLEAVDVDMSSAPDAAVALAVLCSRANGASRIGGLDSLHFKESDRLAALEQELTTYGAETIVEGDTLTVSPGSPRMAILDSHSDHRLAMSFSLLGLVPPGIEVEGVESVSKTWPEYWSWFADTGAIVTLS